MKHITTELEAKIRNQIAFVDDILQAHIDQRKSVEVETGELPPVGNIEAEAATWRRALNWVLSESEC